LLGGSLPDQRGRHQWEQPVMFGRRVHDGEAEGLPVRADVCVVRLRMSPVDRLLWVLRSILSIAFGLAVLWVGGAVLASPASAAVAVPVQTVAFGATKGGKASGSRSTGSQLFVAESDDDGGDDDGGDSDSDGGDSDSDGGDSESGEDSGSESESEDSRSDDSGSSEDSSSESEDSDSGSDEESESGSSRDYEESESSSSRDYEEESSSEESEDAESRESSDDERERSWDAESEADEESSSEWRDEPSAEESTESSGEWTGERDDQSRESGWSAGAADEESYSEESADVESRESSDDERERSWDVESSSAGDEGASSEWREESSAEESTESSGEWAGERHEVSRGSDWPAEASEEESSPVSLRPYSSVEDAEGDYSTEQDQSSDEGNHSESDQTHWGTDDDGGARELVADDSLSSGDDLVERARETIGEHAGEVEGSVEDQLDERPDTLSGARDGQGEFAEWAPSASIGDDSGSAGERWLGPVDDASDEAPQLIRDGRYVGVAGQRSALARGDGPDEDAHEGEDAAVAADVARGMTDSVEELVREQGEDTGAIARDVLARIPDWVEAASSGEDISDSVEAARPEERDRVTRDGEDVEGSEAIRAALTRLSDGEWAAEIADDSPADRAGFERLLPERLDEPIDEVESTLRDRIGSALRDHGDGTRERDDLRALAERVGAEAAETVDRLVAASPRRGEAVMRDASDRRPRVDAEALRRIGDRVADVVQEAVSGGDVEDLVEAVKELADEVSRSVKSGEGPSQHSMQQLAVLARDSGKKRAGERPVEPGGGDDGLLPDEAGGADLCLASGGGCGAETFGSRLLTAESARGPPHSSIYSDDTALTNARGTDAADNVSSGATRLVYDDSPGIALSKARGTDAARNVSSGASRLMFDDSPGIALSKARGTDAVDNVSSGASRLVYDDSPGIALTDGRGIDAADNVSSGASRLVFDDSPGIALTKARGTDAADNVNSGASRLVYDDSPGIALTDGRGTDAADNVSSGASRLVFDDSPGIALTKARGTDADAMGSGDGGATRLVYDNSAGTALTDYRRTGSSDHRSLLDGADAPAAHTSEAFGAGDITAYAGTGVSGPVATALGSDGIGDCIACIQASDVVLVTSADTLQMNGATDGSSGGAAANSRTPAQKKTNAALNARLKAEKAEKKLNAQKKQVAAGDMSKATYNKHVKAYQALDKKADAAAKKVSAANRKLINSVVAGQQKLANPNNNLTKAQQKKIAAQTEKLQKVTGNDVVDPVKVGKKGAAGACGRSGAFTSCNTAATNKKTRSPATSASPSARLVAAPSPARARSRRPPSAPRRAARPPRRAARRPPPPNAGPATAPCPRPPTPSRRSPAARPRTAVGAAAATRAGRSHRPVRRPTARARPTARPGPRPRPPGSAPATVRSPPRPTPVTPRPAVLRATGAAAPTRRAPSPAARARRPPSARPPVTASAR
jgi:hypothetical protein